MHSTFVNSLNIVLFMLFAQNAARHLSGVRDQIRFQIGERLHLDKRFAVESQRLLRKDLDSKRDVSQLHVICSFYPESYISMEYVSGKLTPVKKFRHVPFCCPGYERHGSGDDTDPYRCVPACHHCTYGKCVSPNICRCDDGYENPSKYSSTCVPKCFPPCRNSHCASPNRCVCEKGFEVDEFFPNQCIKKRRHLRMSEVLEKQNSRSRDVPK